MPDTLLIRDLKLDCVVGVYEYERQSRRPLVFNIELTADLHPGVHTDRVEDTLSYEALYHDVCGLAESSEYRLIEALAEAVADCCLKYERVIQVAVQVDKPDVFPQSASCAVRIIRSKDRK